MAVLVGIDGTGGGSLPGKSRDEQYDRDFANSFVKRLCSGGATYRKYFRGPVTLGGGLWGAIAEGAQFVVDTLSMDPWQQVLLTGYSRGAAGAVAVAKRLKSANISVRALMLFDCVDRHLVIDASVIPDNVEYVMHVVRDPQSNSSKSFSNDALRYTPPTVYPAAYKFLCTHGGMGGTPWQPKPGQPLTDLIEEGFPDGKTTISFANDARVSKEVWRYVQPFLRTHGFLGGVVATVWGLFTRGSGPS